MKWLVGALAVLGLLGVGGWMWLRRRAAAAAAAAAAPAAAGAASDAAGAKVEVSVSVPSVAPAPGVTDSPPGPGAVAALPSPPAEAAPAPAGGTVREEAAARREAARAVAWLELGAMLPPPLPSPAEAAPALAVGTVREEAAARRDAARARVWLDLAAKQRAGLPPPAVPRGTLAGALAASARGRLTAAELDKGVRAEARRKAASQAAVAEWQAVAAAQAKERRSTHVGPGVSGVVTLFTTPGPSEPAAEVKAARGYGERRS